MPRSDAHDARNAAFRQAFGNPFEYKESAAPTAEVITEEAKKLDIPHFVEDVPAGKGARIHWLGDRSAKKVLLYFHGACSKKISIEISKQRRNPQLINPRRRILLSSFPWARQNVEPVSADIEPEQ